MILLASQHVCGKPRPTDFVGRVDPTTPCWLGRSNREVRRHSPESLFLRVQPSRLTFLLSAQEKSLAGSRRKCLCRRMPWPCSPLLRILIREKVGRYWLCAPPAISNGRIAMTSSSFIAQSDSAEGWVLLAGDGPQHARNDTAAWRGAMTLAAVDALHRSFPGSDKWPVACAEGFPEEEKALATLRHCSRGMAVALPGIYMTGANEDHLSDGYARVQPGGSFLNTPIYISAGHDDRIATVEQQYTVAGSIKRTGFQRMRIGTFHGGHEVNDGQTSVALGWFRQLAK